VSVRDQVISEFLEVYLDDDQLWAAGGAADIQRLLHDNIDDRGRLNGKTILNFLVTHGVPMPAARAAMDRFVEKRRASIAAARSGTSAPAASSSSSGAPRASGVARAEPSSGGLASRPHGSGIGVTSAAVARERSQAAMRAPAMPAASSALPWGADAEPDTDATPVHGGYDEEATQISAAFSGEQSVSQAPRAMETSSPGRRPPTSIRGGMPRQPGPSLDPPAAPTPANPPPMMLDPSALTEITDPSRASPSFSGESGKRSASEIRGAPIAASAAASTSGPVARASSTPPTPSGPPSAFASGPPSALASGAPSAFAGAPSATSKQAKRAKRAGKSVLSGDMADALGITARKEAAIEQARQEAIKQDHTLGRVERNPEDEKGPVHPGVFFALAGLILTGLGASWFTTKPVPPTVAFTASERALPCHQPSTWGSELICRLPQAALEQPLPVLSTRLQSARSEAKAAGYQGVWFFIEETDRLWAPPHALWATTSATATDQPGSGSDTDTDSDEPGGDKKLPSKEGSIDDIVNGLAVPPPTADEGDEEAGTGEAEPDEPGAGLLPPDPDEAPKKPSKKTKKKKKSKKKQRRKRR
jgi:hypothetical protein